MKKKKIHQCNGRIKYIYFDMTMEPKYPIKFASLCHAHVICWSQSYSDTVESFNRFGCVCAGGVFLSQSLSSVFLSLLLLFIAIAFQFLKFDVNSPALHSFIRINSVFKAIPRWISSFHRIVALFLDKVIFTLIIFTCWHIEYSRIHVQLMYIHWPNIYDVRISIVTKKTNNNITNEPRKERTNEKLIANENLLPGKWRVSESMRVQSMNHWFTSILPYLVLSWLSLAWIALPSVMHTIPCMYSVVWIHIDAIGNCSFSYYYWYLFGWNISFAQCKGECNQRERRITSLQNRYDERN